MFIGYARVSTQGQTLESQVELLETADCSKIHREIASGARSERPQLQALIKGLEPGSTIVVTRLDRLARSTIDLLTTIKLIADKGCTFKSLADPWADTTTPAGRLMLTVLGGLAEFERELIKARTSEGRERAKRAGVRMGRKPKLSAHQVAEIRVRKAGGESVRYLARSYGVSPNTISRVR
jgi:DNA invertase Pin-like site-specific DNA recombinase